jgi:hypothetical protein
MPERTNEQRRRSLFWRLSAVTAVTTMFALFISSSITLDLALISWVTFVGFYAVAMYAVSQQWMRRDGLPLPVISMPRINVSNLHFPTDRLASIRNLHSVIDDSYDEYEDDSEYYEDGQSWQRQEQRRSAVG